MDGAAMRLSRRDPGWFFEHVLGWTPWSMQLRIANAVGDAIHGICGCRASGRCARKP